MKIIFRKNRCELWPITHLDACQGSERTLPEEHRPAETQLRSKAVAARAFTCLRQLNGSRKIFLVHTVFSLSNLRKCNL